MNSQMTRFARGSKCVSFGASGFADFTDSDADDSLANIAANAIPPKPLPAREKNSRRVGFAEIGRVCDCFFFKVLRSGSLCSRDDFVDVSTSEG